MTEMSGTGVDISLVHWKQQWLENGTLYFHVSMSSAENLSQVTPPPLREASEIVDEQMHVLHISVMLCFGDAQFNTWSGEASATLVRLTSFHGSKLQNRMINIVPWVKTAESSSY
ncbi:Astrotactin-2 [Acipenser ruthenus]|uniref:Astrotactin-2 n=1 Tax=Acipenser ruthenus TaxID=7906 RepID=A0A662YL31_ACIRT|nr:Astrotactin-2 [Acipenser ruthenus]